MTALTTVGIHHVALVTADTSRSVVFYRDALGFTLLSDEADPTRAVFGDASGAPGTLLTVHAQRGGHGQPGIGGIHHTAFGVEDEDGLLKWKRRLTDLGCAVSGPYDRGYFTSLYFRDPDGQILELATAGPGYAIDEPAGALGRELVLPPQRIVRGHRDERAIAALTHDEPVPEITPDMILQGIHHVSGITDDLAAAHALYDGVLGLRLIKKTINRDDPNQLHYFWAKHEGGDVAPHSAFTLFGWPQQWKRARAGVGQTAHVAFRVRDADELDAWEEQLRANGVDVEWDDGYDTARAGAPHAGNAARAGARRIRFAAPDGLRHELVVDDAALADRA